MKDRYELLAGLYRIHKDTKNLFERNKDIAGRLKEIDLLPKEVPEHAVVKVRYNELKDAFDDAIHTMENPGPTDLLLAFEKAVHCYEAYHKAYSSAVNHALAVNTKKAN